MSNPIDLQSQDAAATPSNGRPAVLDLVTTPEGRTFRLVFQAGQSLPFHHNPERIVITAEAGTGTLYVGDSDSRQLAAGVVVQLEPGTPHAVDAGEEGLELVVTIAPSCCRMC